MEPIYVFLIRNDVWIYIVCALGLIWYLSELWRSRRLLRSAMFGLEREKGQRIQRRALTFISLFFIIVIIVTYVNLQVAPTLPADLLKPPTPTPDIFATPLSSPTPIGAQRAASTATLAIAPTVTLGSSQSVPPGTPSDTIDSSATPALEPNNQFSSPSECTTEVNISAPPDGATATGNITFFGSATAENFAAFDFEASGPQPAETWQSIVDGGVPIAVSDGILASADFTDWASGLYLFRLSVVDSTGNDIGSCVIQVSLDNASS